MGLQSLLSEYAPQGLEALGVGHDTAGQIGKSIAPILSNAAVGTAIGALTGKTGTGALAGAMNGLLHDKALASLINGTGNSPNENVSVTGMRGNLTDPAVKQSILQSVANSNGGGASTQGSGSAMDTSPYSQGLGMLLAMMSAAGNQKSSVQIPSALNSHLNLPVAHLAQGGGVSALHQAATEDGDRLIKGPGDGTSDSVPADLSNGEYLLTAADVSRIGQGSTEAGAQRLDEMRRAIARDAGAKQHQPRVKHPIQYLQEVSRGNR